MSATTQIGWTDATWNPWHGCTKVSPGCAHCYMYREKERYGQDPTQVVRSKTTFAAPLRWKEPRRIFTCSWSDFFHEGADAWRAEAWDIIRRTPQHTYQILTKRPERIREHLPPDWGSGWPHVWLGVSVENQRFARRAVTLAEIPAVVRFVSAEPLLGPLVLSSIRLKSVGSERFMGDPEEVDVLAGHLYKWDGHVGQLEYAFGRMHWVIVGGESGPDNQRRVMKLEWLSYLVRQCRAAKVAVYVKQDSGRRDSQQGRIPDELWALKEFPR